MRVLIEGIKMKKIFIGVLLFLIILSFGCSGETENFNRKVLDGVIHITNYEKQLSQQEPAISQFISENKEAKFFLDRIFDSRKDVLLQNAPFYFLFSKRKK